jgi:AcrR family transcriptional regulator
MRQLISSTATEMFLERGFDAVKVSEIADACEISEKTIYNYFPTKESLLLDREEPMAAAIRRALGAQATARSPVDAAIEVLDQDLDQLEAFWRIDPDTGLTMFLRFATLIDSTDSLRAAQRDMMDRLVQVAAQAMADRAGVNPDDPEPQIAAHAILGLWQVQYGALRRHAEQAGTIDELLNAVRQEIRRAARLIDAGLWSFNAMVAGRGNREQLKAAAEAAHSAGRQVAAALRQARAAFKELQQEAKSHEPAQRWQTNQERRQQMADEWRRQNADRLRQRREQGQQRPKRDRS